MKSLKRRILEEMVLTDEDKLIFEIIRENSELGKYEKLGRLAFRRLVAGKCEECGRTKCPHMFKPIFTKDWGFRCFIKGDEK